MGAPFYYQLQEAESHVEALKADYLKRFGWSMTCSTPGSYWLWRRDFGPEDRGSRRRWRDRKPGPLGKPRAPIPYGIVTAPIDLAISMTVAQLDLQTEIEEGTY